MPARINGAVLDAEQPEALIYEPQPSGALRLVGVAFIMHELRRSPESL